MASKMVKKNLKNKSTNKVSAKKTTSAKSTKAPTLKKNVAVHEKHDSLKDGLMSINKLEEHYDKVFEQKLAENYRMFRELKEHRLQIRKLGGIIVFILIIILVALLLMTFS